MSSGPFPINLRGLILSDLAESNALCDPRAFACPNVKFGSYRTGHTTLQPVAPAGGQPTNDPNDPSWNWDYFDRSVAQATALGIGAYLRVIVNGNNSPNWLDAFVQTYTDCTSGVVLNVWWDSVWQSYLAAMVQAIAARYGNNPVFKIFSLNISAITSGDWGFPHVAPSSSPTGAMNWQMTNSVTCPAFGGTVTVTPVPNRTVNVGTLVFMTGFGWFQVTKISGPRANPKSATLKNLGIAGNASSGTIPNSIVMQVSDIANLTSPVYNYTTAKLVNALNQVASAVNTALPFQIYTREVGRNGNLDPYPVGPDGKTYQYNAATQMAQSLYANQPAGKVSIQKNTLNAGVPTQSEALVLQDGTPLYLPAQCLPGSQNTSGTTGVIPANSLQLGQFSWPAFDVTGEYSPESTASKAGGPYNANGGVPYDDPFPVFQAEIDIIATYNITVLETYEVDILNLLLPPPPLYPARYPARVFQPFAKVWTPRTPDSSYDSLAGKPPLPMVILDLSQVLGPDGNPLGPEGLGEGLDLQTANFLAGAAITNQQDGTGCGLTLNSATYTHP